MPYQMGTEICFLILSRNRLFVELIFFFVKIGCKLNSKMKAYAQFT